MQKNPLGGGEHLKGGKKIYRGGVGGKGMSRTEGPIWKEGGSDPGATLGPQPKEKDPQRPTRALRIDWSGQPGEER